MTAPILTHARLLQVLDYSPETGKFKWKPRAREEFARESRWRSFNSRISKVSPGSKGRRDKRSPQHCYGRIRIDDALFFAHRLAWFYVHGRWPAESLDHINHDPLDNRIANLREVSQAENQRNTLVFNTSTTKITGVCKASGNKWRAYIVFNYKQIHLGVFDSIEDAAAARKAAERKYGFHENHGGQPRAILPSG